MYTRPNLLRGICAVIFSLWAVASMAGEAVGTIKTSRGEASIQREGASIPATVGTAVEVSDSIVTGANGIVGLTLRDNTRLTAGPNTTMALDQYSFDTTTHAGSMDTTVNRGSLAVISGDIAASNPDAVVFRTPTVTLGVRGTEFIIDTGE
ncbi:MAG: FecR domain-containing protein [Pseudomonadota bacterium]